MSNYFEVLNQVNVNEHIEKKGRFSYLSWPFAYAELFKLHANAEIKVREWDGFPAIKGPKGWMVCVTVSLPWNSNAKGEIESWVSRTQWHPILDNNNKTIAEPDVFQINTSIQRAAVKAIALHGLGLYIYAGEDLPEEPTVTASPQTGAELQNFEPARQLEIKDWASEIQNAWANGAKDDAAKYWKDSDGPLAMEERTCCWSLLDSNVRSGIKKLLKGEIK